MEITISFIYIYGIKKYKKMEFKCKNNINNLIPWLKFPEYYICPDLIFNIPELYTILLEKDGTVIFCTDNLKLLFQNIVGNKLSKFLNKETYEELRKMMLEVLFTNKQIKKDIFLNKIWYKFVVSSIIDDQNVTYLLLNSYDISEKKKIEEENIELKKKLEDANSIKSVFLSNISHELRTPLNSIVGFSELLLEPNQRDQKERFLTSINSNAKYLAELLNNILDYAKIESDEFDLLYENFSINELFDELSDIFKDVNYKKNLDFVKLQFETSEDKKIICDYLRLKQVLFNIISNAIKFTEMGHIDIKFVEVDDSILFSVEDTGCGIPEEKIKFIFDRFWQGDSSSRKEHKGTGLGLAISKSIIEMLNGDIWVESQLKKGSTFFVKIPLEEIKLDLVIKNKEKLNFSDKNILIVDEVPINYSILSIYLNSLHINMLFRYNGKDAIKIYRKQKEKIDLIILDINLPDMNGFELAQKLREIDVDCKIISKSGIEIEKNDNINYHLKKPFSKDKLTSILSEIWQK